MFFLPSLNYRKYNYDNLFRVAIVSYMDEYNFNYDNLPLTNISFITDSFKIIPFDLYYSSHNGSSVNP